MYLFVVNKLFYVAFLKNKHDVTQTRLQTAVSMADYTENILASLKTKVPRDGHPNDAMLFLENRVKTASAEVEMLKQKLNEIDAELLRVSKLQELDVDSRIS